MRRFDQARPFFTLALAVAAWLLLPVAAKNSIRAGFFDFSAPITASASYVRDLQEYWSLRLHSQADLIAAGRDLARVNASYELAAQRNALLQSEVDRLQAQLRMPPRPGYRLETARVAERDLAAWWQRIVIRKGRDFGIAAGSPVVFAGGAVGRVTEVHAYTSVVELISSPGVRLAAVFEGDGRPVSYEGGDNPAFHAPQGRVEFVPPDISPDPASPRRLLTSGLGGVFPAGLSLGRVSELEPSADGLFKTGAVELDPRLSELTEVTVLVPTSAVNPGSTAGGR